ncbi:S8 family serine peptidase [Streptomyces sp. KR80]|uniref:S8 family serine peptidase n=1 Tax=Streptomyces sp. KR80 TaxID=3457426 RepID=UPI003FCF14A9
MDEDPEVEVLTHVRPSRGRRGLGAIAEPSPAFPPVAVVRMSDERARELLNNPQVIVEPDQPLMYSAASPIVPAMPMVDPALAVAFDEPQRITVRVKGSDGAAVPAAHVWAIGAAAPAHAITDADGRAVLTLSSDTTATIRALNVRPMAGYWPVRIDHPRLEGAAESVVELRPLADVFEGFPERPMIAWGQQTMRLNQIPPTYRGHGIRIAILDSGVTSAHRDLKDAVRGGFDFTTGSDRTWNSDATGHGTWCAGVIAAADNRTGVVGIAADTELYACKLLPGGRVSDLLLALDHCLTQDIDIAQLNLACEQPSDLLALKVLDLRAAGVACIAPAGDSGAAVAFPASLPTVLAVGALGHTGTYPPESPHAAYAGRQPAWPGPYAPHFTPVGPGVDLVGPGVAVVTTAPGGDYTPVDGTALAAAHITGLAALVLAHHDHLRTQQQLRTAARVDHLFGLLRASCRQLPSADRIRTGAGLPDAPTALGLQPAVPDPQALRAEMQRAGLLPS